MADLGDVGGIGIGRQRVSILGHRALPLADGKLQTAGFLVDLAQMVMNAGVGRGTLNGFVQVFFSRAVLA